MVEAGDGGSFVEVILRPCVTVARDNMVDACTRLHEKAHRSCYIASSVVFPVRVEAVTEVDGRGESGGDTLLVAFDPWERHVRRPKLPSDRATAQRNR